MQEPTTPFVPLSDEEFEKLYPADPDATVPELDELGNEAVEPQVEEKKEEAVVPEGLKVGDTFYTPDQISELVKAVNETAPLKEATPFIELGQSVAEILQLPEAEARAQMNAQLDEIYGTKQKVQIQLSEYADDDTKALAKGLEMLAEQIASKNPVVPTVPKPTAPAEQTAEQLAQKGVERIQAELQVTVDVSDVLAAQLRTGIKDPVLAYRVMQKAQAVPAVPPKPQLAQQKAEPSKTIDFDKVKPGTAQYDAIMADEILATKYLKHLTKSVGFGR